MLDMNFDQLLISATEKIADDYFKLPVADSEDPIYRERVYCYELYHHLRSSWPEDSTYSLAGEIDKSGHPLIRGNELDRVKPDILVHEPGSMENNLTIMEVKPINARREGIEKDVNTLGKFLKFANYQSAILLFYGSGDIKGKYEIAQKYQQYLGSNVQIHYWWHEHSQSAAKRYQPTA